MFVLVLGTKKHERRLIMKGIIKFFKDEEGVTAIEYGLIAAGIAIAIVAVVFVVGNSLSDVFQSVSDCLSGS